ncbi:MAG: hypothetical protein IKE29_16290 [Paenibacillus sp.]|uniref:hypothetical protein n=1 Tax=Paenibacillus sp. TaxID=58172 RepID=UPI0025D9F6D9|nr:hypothetical protein [Paenibacillus sp.]MBR2566164.1 hypothetical protein [Paenibacillus sp.]
MTREQAIGILKDKSCTECAGMCAYPLENSEGECEYSDALRMAVEALNAQLPTEDTTSHVQIFADGMPLEEYLAREWAKQRAYLEEHGIIFRDGGAE